MRTKDIITFTTSNPTEYSYKYSSLKWSDKFQKIHRDVPILYLRNAVNNNPMRLSNSSEYNSKYINRVFHPLYSASQATFYKSIRDRRTHEYGHITFNLFTGCLSVIGLEKIQLLNTNIRIKETVDRFIHKYDIRPDKYDILVLAVVDSNYLRKRESSSNSILNFNKKKITLLVSKEKIWKNGKYCKEKYTGSLRTYILNFLKQSEAEGMTIRVVPDSYLEQFIITGIPLQTNSLMKIKEIEKEVKNAVFTNINIKQFEDD